MNVETSPHLKLFTKMVSNFSILSQCFIVKLFNKSFLLRKLILMGKKQFIETISPNEAGLSTDHHLHYYTTLYYLNLTGHHRLVKI